MISLLLAGVALLTAGANGQTVASCQTAWETQATNTCSQLGQYEGACNNFYGCLKDSFCQLYDATLQQTLGGLISQYSNCTSGTSCRGFYCNSDFVQYYADVVGCACTFLNDLGATDAQKAQYIGLFADAVTEYCDASLDVGCSGATATVTLPRWKVTFTLQISSWDWSQYTQAQFNTFKEQLRQYIANRLGVWKSQVTITWTYEGSGRRRLVAVNPVIGIELANQADATAIQTAASDSSFTTSLSSDAGVTITESQAPTTSDDTQSFRGDATRNAMTLVTIFVAIAGFMLQ